MAGRGAPKKPTLSERGIVRLNLLLPEQEMQAIVARGNKNHHPTKTFTICYLMRMAEFVEEELDKGNTVLIVTPDGKATKLKIIQM